MSELRTHRFPWLLDWNLLRSFMVIVEQGGITPSARYLGLTQPAVSSALKRLEETMGCRLVERHGRQFSVTDEGRNLYGECRKLFGAISLLPDVIDPEQHALTGHITLEMASHVVSPHLEALLASFNAQHAQITWSININESREVVRKVRQGHATLGVCLIASPPQDLATALLYQERFALYCGAGHRLFGRTDISPDELAGEASVAFQTETETGPLFSVAALRKEMALEPRVKGISASLHEVRRMIEAGFGIGALPVHVADRDVASGRLWPLPPYENLPEINIYALHNPSQQFSRAEARFLQALADMLTNTCVNERRYGASSRAVSR